MGFMELSHYMERKTMKINNKEHFIDAWKKAREIGGATEKSFKRSLETIISIEKNGHHGEALLYPDFVKHSFAFGFTEGKFNGGMILHGFQETFSIELNPANYPHWSIHT